MVGGNEGDSFHITVNKILCMWQCGIRPCSHLDQLESSFFSRSKAIFFERSVLLVKCDPDLLNHYHFRVVQIQHSTKTHAGLKPVLCGAAAL